MCFNDAILGFWAILGFGGYVTETHISPSDRNIFSKKKYVAISPRSGAYVGERNLLLSVINRRFKKWSKTGPGPKQDPGRYLLHHKANGLPYAAFVDDKLVRERGLRMVSHFDLLPYSDEKAMKMLSTQWKYHDPAGTYWTTVEECYTLMAVGHVHRSVSVTTTNESCDPPSPYPSAARAKDCPSDSERGGLRFDARQHNADCRLGAPRRKQLRVAQVVTSSIKNAQDSSKDDRLLLQLIELLLLSTTTCTTVLDGPHPSAFGWPAATHVSARRLRSLTPRHATRCALCVTSATCTLSPQRRECCPNRP